MKSRSCVTTRQPRILKHWEPLFVAYEIKVLRDNEAAEDLKALETLIRGI